MLMVNAAARVPRVAIPTNRNCIKKDTLTRRERVHAFRGDPSGRMLLLGFMAGHPYSDIFLSCFSLSAFIAGSISFRKISR